MTNLSILELPNGVGAPAVRHSSNGASTSRKRPLAASFAQRHRLVFTALALVVLFHGSLLLAGSYQRTYDAFVHIFFADHYARNWFSSWDDRWYTGFSVFSYPPGVHQSIAALSFIVGLRAAFVVVQLGALLLLTVGVYRWAMIWVSREAAGWASLGLVVSSSIAETVHVFGQLPTIMSLGFLLNALPFASRWVQTAHRRSLVAGVACSMATVACHHVTMLFGGVFFLGPVLIAALLAALRTPLADEPGGHPARISARTLWPLTARRLRRVLPSLRRATIFGALVVTALLVVVLPYWLYSQSDPITQVTIPHGSRDNYLANLDAGLMFWVIPWGVTALVLPYALIRGFSRRFSRNTLPLAVSLAVLTLLGTGGTTFLPKLLLGSAYDILTLDRFTFWATISILPFVGLFVVSVLRGGIHRWLAAHLGRTLTFVLTVLLLATHLGFTLLAANLTQYKPFQPAAIALTPITNFLNKDQHSHWRYLTLGFGDQMAWLAANTTAQTVDGDYHSARQLPELTSRPIERLEGAKYTGMPGIGSLQQFLATPERYNLKYVFSNDTFYSPLLDASGWSDLGPLDNGIEVWERADVPPLPTTATSQQGPLWERLMWGTVPPLSILFALAMLGASAAGAFSLRASNPVLDRGSHGVRNSRASGDARASRRRRKGRGKVDGYLLSVSLRLPLKVVRQPVAGHRANGARRSARTVTSPAAPLSRVVSARRRRFQAGIAVTVIVVLGGGSVAAAITGSAVKPIDVVGAYYHDLDFRQFTDAYALLDHASRPSFDEYLRQLGQDSGLVASFAKLSALTARETSHSALSAVVSAQLQYLTSLQLYNVATTLSLRKSGDNWGIVLPTANLVEPPDQFTSRPQVSFLDQARRAPSSATSTSAVDVLDRPQLQLHNLRSLLVLGRWVVIGTVTNADVVPADITIQAQLRNSKGALLASWDAAQVLVHKLLPGATSPFRIEFQSIAGTGEYGTEAQGGLAAAGTNRAIAVGGATGATVSAAKPSLTSRVRGPVEFDPQTITPFVLPKGAVVASVGVYARAVVAAKVASPSLQLTGLTLDTDADGSHWLEGTLRNDGTIEASVPHVLLSYYMGGGQALSQQLAWVDHTYLDHSIAPQTSSAFRVMVPSSSPFVGSKVIALGFAGPLHRAFTDNDLSSGQLALPADTGFTSVGITVSSFNRGVAQ